MKTTKVEPKLTFTELVSLKPGELYAFAKDTIKLNKAVSSARDKFTENLRFAAKVVAAMKRCYIELINKKGIPGDTPFKKYFEQNAGGMCPPRVEALASLFNALVETNLLKEEYFDAAAVDWLEKANAIISAARKTHGDEWKGCDDVLDVVNALSNPGDALKTLKEIRKRQKEAETTAATATAGEAGENAGAGVAGETTPLTLAVAVAFITASFGAAGGVKPDRQMELCAALYELNDAWCNNSLSENRRKELDDLIENAREHGVAPGVKVTHGAELAAK